MTICILYGVEIYCPNSNNKMKVKTHKKPIYIIIDDTLFQTLEEQVTYWNSNLLAGCKKLNLDFMVYFIDLITKKSKEKESTLVNGHVRLFADYLRKVLHNYNYQIDFLISKGFINRIPYSKSKKESFGYKVILPEKSLAQKRFRTYDFTSFTLKKKLSAKKSLLKDKADKTTAHITKWLSDSVLFDYDRAVDFLHSKVMNDSKLYHRLYCCEVLKGGNILYSRNGKDNRLHSTFTSLPSELRQFLKFKGSDNHLVSLDIKSSQPFHLAGLINLMINKQYDKIDYLSKLIKETRLRNKFNSCMSLMIPKTLEELINIELQRFVKIVTDQDVYEYIGSKFSEDHLKRITKGSNFNDMFYNSGTGKKHVKSFTTLRDYCKLAMLEYMYCSIKSKEKRYLEIRRILPNAVNEIIDTLKEIKSKLKDSKNDFPIILQNIEAGLFLDVLCKDFSQQHENTPFITIHDSIMVDSSMKTAVHNIFINGYKDILGIVPVLD
jgi:hypothetical protein